MSQLYSISFYICWRMERRPVFDKLSEVAKELINKELLPELPKFGKLNPTIGNECIKKFHTFLADFKFKDKQITASVRHPDGVENFAAEDKKDHVLGQYKLTFSVYSKAKDHADTYAGTLPKLLNEIKKIVVQTDKAVIRITDFRTSGEVKQHPGRWPKDGETFF